MSFTTEHLSLYMIGYNVKTFTDTSGHWAKDSITFVTARGMFVTVLGRLADANVSAYKKSSFTDVKANAYYMPYIEWAVANKIVTSIGGGNFGPDTTITRKLRR